MAESTYMVSEQGDVFPAVVATGSVVAGDFVSAYQTDTDDVFAEVSKAAYNPGSVFVLRQAADNKYAVGIAGMNGASGDKINVITKGLFIVGTNGATAGDLQAMDGAQVVNDTAGSSFVGRALTGGSTSSKYILLRLNC